MVRYGDEANWEGLEYLNDTLTTTWTTANTHGPTFMATGRTIGPWCIRWASTDCNAPANG